MDIGFEIRKLRENKKMSQCELAAELEISQSTPVSDRNEKVL